MNERLAAALAAIDAANRDDPNTVELDGAPWSLAHAQGALATDWVLFLDPDASDAQLLAASAHHLRRWESPRTDYPDGRAGYLRWRTAAKRRHADDVAELLAATGYGADAIARVQQIIRKEGLGADPDVQVHEDALCLAFLQTQLDAVAASVGADKMVDILARTVAKMSPAGLAAATTLPLSDEGTALLQRALAAPARRRSAGDEPPTG